MAGDRCRNAPRTNHRNLSLPGLNCPDDTISCISTCYPAARVCLISGQSAVGQDAAISPAAIVSHVFRQEAIGQCARFSPAAIVCLISGQRAVGQDTVVSSSASALVLFNTGSIICQDAVVQHTFRDTAAIIRGIILNQAIAQGAIVSSPAVVAIEVEGLIIPY